MECTVKILIDWLAICFYKHRTAVAPLCSRLLEPNEKCAFSLELMVLNRSPVLLRDFILYLNYGFISVITAIVPCLYNICTLHSSVLTVWLQQRWGTKPVTLRWQRHCPVRTGSKTVSRWADAWRANLAGCFLLLISGSCLKTSAQWVSGLL